MILLMTYMLLVADVREKQVCYVQRGADCLFDHS